LSLCLSTYIPQPLFAQSEALPYTLPQRSEIHKLKSAEIITNRGSMVFELYPEEAPRHVANFKYLADIGFYRGVKFHIFEKDYILQAGIPFDLRVPNYSIPPEFSEREHKEGTLGMARVANDINTMRASSATQFHLLLRQAPHMDKQYTIFGQLIKGEDVLERLGKNDTILSVKVFVAKDL